MEHRKLTWTPATNRQKQLSIKAAPMSVLMRKILLQSSVVKPAATLPISFAQTAVSRAAIPAETMATGGIDG
jgi:hypothetical protein